MKSKTFNKEVNLFKDEVMHMITHAFDENGNVPPSVMMFMYQEGGFQNTNKQPIGVMVGFDELMNSDIGKQTLAKAIGQTVKDQKPIALAFISEAYAIHMSQGKGESIEDMKKRVAVLKEAGKLKKEETLLINIETHCMECHIRYVINRDSGKPVLELQEDELGWEEKCKDAGILQNFITECYVDIEDDVDDISTGDASLDSI